MTGNNVLQPLCLKEDKPEPLDKAGADLKWQCLGAECPSSCCYPYAARIYIHEIIPLSQRFPITFALVDRAEGKQDIDICFLLRINRKNNYCAYLHKGMGCVLGDERPIACKQYPFSIVRDRAGEVSVGVRLSCPGFSRSSGQLVIMPDNKLSPVIEEECIKPATSGFDAREETKRFVDTLKKYNLIVDGQFNHRGEGVAIKLVDAKKLRELPEEIREDLRAKGYMELIYAHMDSIFNCSMFIDIYLERAANGDLRD